MDVCNATNTTTRQCQMQPLEGVGYTVVFVFGLILNAAALRVFVAKRARWTDTHVYMLNLNLADFALILFLPFRTYDAFFCLEKTYLCSFLINTHYINTYASILTATAISVHRYLAVRFPLRARAWKRKKETALGLCVAIWVTVVAICTAFRRATFPKNLYTCYERRRDHPLSPWFLTVLLGLGYMVPLLIILFCSIQTISILLKDTDKYTSAEKRKTVSIVAANMVVFIFCYTPVHVGLLIRGILEPPSNWESQWDTVHIFWLAVEWIATTNCCLDSISYYFLLKHFYLK